MPLKFTTMAVEKVKHLLYPEVAPLIKATKRVISNLGDNPLSRLGRLNLATEQIAETKVKAYFHEKDWATIWQSYSNEQSGPLNEFFEFVEGVKDPEISMKKCTESAIKAKKDIMEQQSSWVQKSTFNRKRSYNVYKAGIPLSPERG